MITIAREFGAGGETVGRLLAERMQVDLVDSRIIDEVAHRLELPESEVEAADEDPASLVERLVVALGASSIDLSAPPEAPAWSPPFQAAGLDLRKAVLQVTQQVIQEAARQGNAVIVGRGAASVLHGAADVLHVFLYAPVSDRIPVVAQMLNIDLEAARRRIRETDVNRAAYIKQVYGQEWRRPDLYDLMLNSARLGYEGCCEAILAALARRP